MPYVYSAGVYVFYIIETPNSVFSVNAEIEIFIANGSKYRQLCIFHVLSKLLHVI